MAAEPLRTTRPLPAVLLVEDNLDDVILTRRAFKKAGIAADLVVVEDGEKAMGYLGGSGAYADRADYPWPALVLLDLKLPRASGFEVLEWIRSIAKLATLPVVVMTSSTQTEDIDRAYAAGANSYLEKPVHFQDLEHIVRQLDLYWLDLNLPSARAAR